MECWKEVLVTARIIGIDLSLLTLVLPSARSTAISYTATVFQWKVRNDGSGQPEMQQIARTAQWIEQAKQVCSTHSITPGATHGHSNLSGIRKQVIFTRETPGRAPIIASGFELCGIAMHASPCNHSSLWPLPVQARTKRWRSVSQLVAEEPDEQPVMFPMTC